MCFFIQERILDQRSMLSQLVVEKSIQVLCGYHAIYTTRVYQVKSFPSKR